MSRARDRARDAGVVLSIPGAAVNTVRRLHGPAATSSRASASRCSAWRASVTGGVVASRVPGNAVGWLLIALGVGVGVISPSAPTARWLHDRLGPLRGDACAAWLGDWSAIVTVFVGPPGLLLLFPDGHLLSPRWRSPGGGSPPACGIATAATRSPRSRGGDARTPSRGHGEGHALVRRHRRRARGARDRARRRGRSCLRLQALPRHAERLQLKWFSYCAAIGGHRSGRYHPRLRPGRRHALPDRAPRYGAAARDGGHRDPALPALRHRRRHQPHARLRRADGDAGRCVPRPRAAARGVLCAAHRRTPTWRSRPRRWRSRRCSARRARASRRVVDRRFYRRRYDAARTLEAFGARLRDEVDLDASAPTCAAWCARRCSPRTSRSGCGAPERRDDRARSPGWPGRCGRCCVALARRVRRRAPTAGDRRRLRSTSACVGVHRSAFATIGALVAARRPAQPDRLALCSRRGLAFADRRDLYAVVARRRARRGPPSRCGAGWAAGLDVGARLAATFVLLLFPDGRLPSRRWRPVAWLGGRGVAPWSSGIALDARALRGPDRSTNPFGLDDAPACSARWERRLALLLGVASSSASPRWSLRFRRARGVGAPAAQVAGLRRRASWRWCSPSSVVIGSLVGADPAVDAGQRAVVARAGGRPGRRSAIAILRHRLYDIDVVINRTLVYGALTATLAAVTSAGAAAPGVLAPWPASPTWRSPVSTLAVAALFRPLRRAHPGRRRPALLPPPLRRGAHARGVRRAALRDEVDLERAERATCAASSARPCSPRTSRSGCGEPEAPR